MKSFTNALKTFFPLAAASTILAGTAYAGIQQSIRQAANDPQIQMARDAALSLKKGATPESLVTFQANRVANSLSPFLIITDSNYKVLAKPYSSQAGGEVPPDGSFVYAKDHGENQITWETGSDYIRLATVIVPYTGSKSGFVVAARPLEETEKRENQLTNIFALGWVLMLVISFIFTWVLL